MNRRHTIVLVLALVLTAAMLCSCVLFKPIDSLGEKKFEGKLAVHFLDVGQGDAIFVELPSGETMLIDAGENRCGKGIIRYIQGAGHDRIDYLVATHPHTDHIGSMPYIIRHFEVGEVWMPAVTANTATFAHLLEEIEKKKLAVHEGLAGTTVTEAGGCSAVILAPATLDEENLNNCSIVMKITFGSRSFLFTGDAELEETEPIVDKLGADVLKVAHHGSSNANNLPLLQAIHPAVAVISCGDNNDFGHPHSVTLSALKKTESRVYRTDREHTVVISTDGETLDVLTDNGTIGEE